MMSHFWMRGVKCIPLIYPIAQTLFSAIVEELDGTANQFLSTIKRCFTHETGRFIDIYEINSSYTRTVFMPKSWMPEEVQEREVLEKALSLELTQKIKGSITVKLSRVFQSLDITWDVEGPPTKDAARRKTKELNKFINEILSQCRDCYYLSY